MSNASAPSRPHPPRLTTRSGSDSSTRSRRIRRERVLESEPERVVSRGGCGRDGAEALDIDREPRRDPTREPAEDVQVRSRDVEIIEVVDRVLQLVDVLRVY